jgi:hypothetical protein
MHGSRACSACVTIACRTCPRQCCTKSHSHARLGNGDLSRVGLSRPNRDESPRHLFPSSQARVVRIGIGTLRVSLGNDDGGTTYTHPKLKCD